MPLTKGNSQTMITQTDINPLLSAAAEFARSQMNCGDITEAEDAVTEITRAMADAMMQTLAAQFCGQREYDGAHIGCDCGKRARYRGLRGKDFQTLHGIVRVKRGYYRCDHCKRTSFPWDGRQGLSSHMWTPRVKELVASVSSTLPYEQTSLLLVRTSGLSIEESCAEQIVAEVGGALRREDAGDIVKAVDTGTMEISTCKPKRLYIAMDAVKAHTDGEWHDVKVGVIYEGVIPEGKATDTLRNPRYIAAQETSEAFGRRVYTKAIQRGYDNAVERVVIGDGAEWIWNEANNHLNPAIKIIDYYHACEHIYGLARVLYGEGDKNGGRWAASQCKKLRNEGPGSFITALRRRKAQNKQQTEALRLQLGYFTKYRKYMKYPSYDARGMMIGSGPVESACKIVVGQRLKQAGMRWTREGSDSVLAVRSALLSGELARIERASRAA